MTLLQQHYIALEMEYPIETVFTVTATKQNRAKFWVLTTWIRTRTGKAFLPTITSVISQNINKTVNNDGQKSNPLKADFTTFCFFHIPNFLGSIW